MKGPYKLTLADADGVVLNSWLVTVGAPPNDETYNLGKPMARSSVMSEIVNEIETHLEVHDDAVS
jgi:hypothetical protein